MKSVDDDDGEVSKISKFAPSPNMILLGAVSGFILLAWYAYNAGTPPPREDDLLVIEADKTPVKEIPKNPSGMEFPNQDKTIFETFSTNKQPDKVERVLPPPEEPIEINSAEEAVIKEIDAHVKPSAIAEKVTSDKPPITEPEAEKPLPEKNNNIGKIKIQLGAVSSEKEAGDTWKKLQQKFPQLMNKSPIIVRADVKGKIFYRIRSGGFSDKDSAKSFCNSLSAKGQACIVVKD